MLFPIHQFIFFFFAIWLIFSAIMTITLRNPVHAVLFLVLTFFAGSVLWMLLQAEFLSLVLIFVYVGAVMTLFLFVVMMINIDTVTLKKKFVRYLPIGVLATALLIGMLLLVLAPSHFPAAVTTPISHSANYSNVSAMGMLLYTDYLFPFEIAAVLLLVAIIAAISLAFHGQKTDTKTQVIAEQHRANKKNRLKIIE